MKWSRELGELDSSNIQMSFLSCTKNTTLLWFQDKITHRILTTNTFVAKFMDTSPLCTFCGNYRETLMHLFVYCEQVQCVWRNIEATIRRSLNCVITLNGRRILLHIDLGGSFGIEIKNAIQHLILMGKYYI